MLRAGGGTVPRCRALRQAQGLEQAAAVPPRTETAIAKKSGLSARGGSALAETDRHSKVACFAATCWPQARKLQRETEEPSDTGEQRR